MRAIGATEFNIQRGIYTYIELTEPNGRRVSLQQVITSPKMDGYLALSARPEYSIFATTPRSI